MCVRARTHTHIVSIHTQLLYNAGKRCHSLKTEQQTTMVARNTVAQLPISMLFICNSSNHTQACILHFTHQNTLTHTDTLAPFFKHSHSVKKNPISVSTRFNFNSLFVVAAFMRISLSLSFLHILQNKPNNTDRQTDTHTELR